MDENPKPPPDKFGTILEKLDHIDFRINNKGWVTFIGIVIILGVIVALLSPVCGGLLLK